MKDLKINGITIYLERRRTRLTVGVLNKVNNKFVFTYDDVYFKAKNIIPLGPEFPLTKKQFVADKLFPSLLDRIPSKQNPAYAEYCMQMGIDPKERDPFILLSTIGRRGPSSFVFSPLFERSIDGEKLMTFRNFLGLTTREFAKVFEFSHTSLNEFEKGRMSGKDVIKRLEILLNFPEVAIYLLNLNNGVLTHAKWVEALKKLKSLI